MTGHRVQPFGPRVAVVDPPLEPQQQTGIILPPGYERVKSGVVQGVGLQVGELEAGDFVWYKDDESNIEIADVTLVLDVNVVAFERPG